MISLFIIFGTLFGILGWLDYVGTKMKFGEYII